MSERCDTLDRPLGEKSRHDVFGAAHRVNARGATGGQDEVSAHARDVHARAIVVDTHDDTTQRMMSEPSFDIGAEERAPAASTSRECARAASTRCSSLFTCPATSTGPAAVETRADTIDPMREAVDAHPRELLLATIDRGYPARRRGTQDRRADGHRRRAHDRRRPRCRCASYAALGVRYMTLTHSRNTTWADSSGDKPAAQRPHAVWQGCRARDQPPRYDGDVSHVGQDVLRRPRGHEGSRDCVAFLVPRASRTVRAT